jgi:glycosyltransferase involved in cell wall biosynthesis
MSDPLVSIIIPVYNSARHLEETILSAINQTWANKEIILVDDGSQDSSLAIAKVYEGERVKVFSQANAGASAARNKGLREAKGDYIQFLDGDDLLGANKIALQVDLLNKHESCVAIGDIGYFTDGADPDEQRPERLWYDNGCFDPVDFAIKLYGGGLIGENYGGMITVHSWLTPRSVIDKAGLWNEELNLNDDGEFFCRVLLASRAIYHVPGAVNYYRKFDTTGNLSSQKNAKAAKSLLKATDLQAAALLNKTNDPRAILAVSRIYWQNAIMLYPQHTRLVREAEKKAKDLNPSLALNPYSGGFNKILCAIIGWKAVRYLQYLKNKIFGNELPI